MQFLRKLFFRVILAISGGLAYAGRCFRFLKYPRGRFSPCTI